MAVPSNTFQTYQAIGNREDLSDVIYRIDPTDTPCMTAFEREKASLFTAVPTAANDVNEDDVISFTPSGATGSATGAFFAVIRRA